MRDRKLREAMRRAGALSEATVAFTLGTKKVLTFRTWNEFLSKSIEDERQKRKRLQAMLNALCAHLQVEIVEIPPEGAKFKVRIAGEKRNAVRRARNKKELKQAIGL